MILKLFVLILAIFKITQSVSFEGDFNNSDENNDVFLLKIPLTKLQTILEETEKVNENLMDLNGRLQVKDESLQLLMNNVTRKLEGVDERLNAQTDSLQTLQKQNENISQSLNRQELLTNSLSKDISLLKNFLTKSLDIKSLNQNREWTVIQRRQDGSVDFFRNWLEYKRGFGNPNGEFWLGLEKLHAMTTFGAQQELLIVLEDFENQTRYAKYDKFVVGSEAEKYALKELGDYSGDAGDSLRYHEGQKFTTKDQDNDNNEVDNCAGLYLKGAWWFNNCYTSHLNGPYFQGGTKQKGGINWIHWHGNEYSLKFVEMMIRSKI